MARQGLGKASKAKAPKWSAPDPDDFMLDDEDDEEEVDTATLNAEKGLPNWIPGNKAPPKTSLSVHHRYEDFKEDSLGMWTNGRAILYLSGGNRFSGGGLTPAVLER
ncbi:hypothetical protein KC365_g15986 [Hortaea werneckii]|nr:hypothetical protein KC365_g15986 [Hortaea werneckii]